MSFNGDIVVLRGERSLADLAPDVGGDTIWANSALAYRALSPTMQGLLRGLKVHMSMGNVLESARAYAPPNDNSIGRLAQTL